MNKIYLILSNEIQEEFLVHKVDYKKILINKFNKKIDISNTPTPLALSNKTRDIVQLIDCLQSLNEAYELLEYCKDLIDLIKMSKSKYLKIYKKDKDKNTLLKEINLDEKTYNEQLRKVITDSSEYIFEFLTCEE